MYPGEGDEGLITHWKEEEKVDLHSNEVLKEPVILTETYGGASQTIEDALTQISHRVTTKNSKALTISIKRNSTDRNTSTMMSITLPPELIEVIWGEARVIIGDFSNAIMFFLILQNNFHLAVQERCHHLGAIEASTVDYH